MSLIRINVDGEVDTSNIDKLLSLLVNYSITIKSGEETSHPQQPQQLQKTEGSNKRKRKVQSDSSVMNSLIQIQNLKQRGMSSKEAGKELGYSEPSVSLILTTQKIIDMFEKIAPSVRDKEEYEEMLKELKVRLDIKPRCYNQISLGHIGTLRFLITYSHILSVDRRVEILRKLLGWNTPQKETMSADIFLEYIKTIEASMNKIS